MKKFLFTLASLFVAGTAFANSYLYIDKVEVTADMVGEELEIPVKAHYEEYVSAWEMWVEAPEGLEVTGCEAGEGMTISYYNSRGKAATLTAPIYGADGHFITAVADAGYTPDKVTYGCVKWAPGEYEEMLLLYVEVTDAYVGGDISIRFEPACGQDTRFGDDMRAKVAWGNTVPWIDETMVAAEPELAADDAENPTKVIATDGAVLYRLDETTTAPVWVKVENPFDLPEPAATEQTIQFMACMPNGDGLVGSDFVPLTVVIPAATTPAQPAPEPTITYENGQVSAAVAGEDPAEHEVELYIVNGEERTKVENPYTPTQTWSQQEITFVAVTLANDDESENTECDPVTVIIDAKPDKQLPQPEFMSYTEDGQGAVVARLTNLNDIVVDLYLKVNGEWQKVDNPYVGLPLTNNSYTEDIVYEFMAIARADMDEYNKDNEKDSIAIIFENLMKLVNDMDAEQKRYVREGFDSDEELTMFDLLVKDSLSKEEIKKVKKLAQTMLAKIKARIHELDHWRDKEETQSIISVLIRDILWAELPESYDDAAIADYRNQIYEYVYNAYPAA